MCVLTPETGKIEKEKEKRDYYKEAKYSKYASFEVGNH